MEILISIIFLAFAILQIALFFKLWKMTNDVRKIQESITYTNDDFGYWVLLDEKEKAFKILKKELFDALISCNDVCYAKEFNGSAQKIIDEYKEKAKSTGHELPEVLADPEKFKEFYDSIQS